MSSNNLNIFKCINIFEHVLYRTLVTLSLHFILADRKTHGFHILRRFLWRFHGSHIAPMDSTDSMVSQGFPWFPRFFHGQFHGFHGFPRAVPRFSTVFPRCSHGFPRFSTVSMGPILLPWIPLVPWSPKDFYGFQGTSRSVANSMDSMDSLRARPK